VTLLWTSDCMHSYHMGPVPAGRGRNFKPRFEDDGRVRMKHTCKLGNVFRAKCHEMLLKPFFASRIEQIFNFLCSQENSDGSPSAMTAPFMESLVVNKFHQIWYNSEKTWTKNSFLGYPILQCPFDLQVYQEVVWQTKPSFIIQTGVAYGGSVLYFASLLDLIGDPDSLVIGIDIALTDESKMLKHPRIRLIEASSVDPEVLKEVRRLVPAGKGFVSLDSDHHRDHVLSEIEVYREFVAPGSYLVVEDVNINGHPVFPEYGPGPREAVDAFLAVNDCFMSVSTRNKITFHEWLLRTK